MKFGTRCFLRRGSLDRFVGEGKGRIVRVVVVGAYSDTLLCKLLDDDLDATVEPFHATETGWFYANDVIPIPDDDNEVKRVKKKLLEKYL